KLTFITIAKRGNLRLFYPAPDLANLRNPEPGIVLDDPALCAGKVPSFYMISQAIVKGSAIPTHYSVLLQGDMTLDFIENFTHRLCLMYFNCSAAISLPAPVMYAKKLAFFVGTVVRKPPHKRLQRTLFYL
ncbi:unnamed protein product, partial [Effrenium voratum]